MHRLTWIPGKQQEQQQQQQRRDLACRWTNEHEWSPNEAPKWWQPDRLYVRCLSDKEPTQQQWATAWSISRGGGRFCVLASRTENEHTQTRGGKANKQKKLVGLVAGRSPIARF